MVLLTKEDYRMIRRAMDHRREITLTRKVQGAAATVIIHAAPPVGGCPDGGLNPGPGAGMVWLQTFASVSNLEEAVQSWKGA